MAMECGAIFSIKDHFSNKATSIISATERMKKSVTSVSDAVKQNDGVWRDTNGRLRDARGRFISAGDAANKGAKGIKNFIKSMNCSKMDSFIGKLKMLGGAYLGISGLKKLGSAAIDGAANFEQYRNTLNVVMKDQKKAGETFRWAVDFANKTPFETNQVVDATVKLQSYGLNAKKVMTDIGNMSGVMGKSLDQGVEAIADAQTGELERLKEFGITKQMIVDQANRTMKGKEIVNKKGQITDQKAFNTALFGLMKERYKGGMELQAKTYKGSMSTIKGMIGNTFAALGGVTEDGTVEAGGALDILKHKVTDVSNAIQKWAKGGGIKRLCERMKQGFHMVGQAINFLKQHMNTIIPIVSGVVAGFAAFKTMVKVASMVNKVRRAFMMLNIASFGLKAMFAVSPFGLIAIGIGLCVAAGVALYKNWDKIKAMASKVWNKVANSCKQSALKMKNAFNGIKAKIVSAFKGIGAKIKGVFTGIGNNIKKSFTNIKNKVTNSIKSLGVKIKNAFTKIKTTIKGAISGIGNFIKSHFGTQIKAFANVFKNVANIIKQKFNIIKNVVLGGVLIVLDLITGKWRKIPQDVKRIFNAVKQSIHSIWNSIKSIFISVGTVITSTIKSTWNGLKTIVNTSCRFISNTVKAIWHGIQSVFSSVCSAITSTVSSAWNGLKSIVSSVCSSIASTIHSVWSGILSFFASLPSTLMSMGVNMFNALKNGCVSILSTLGGVIKSGMDSALSFIKNLPSMMFHWGCDMIKGLINGIKSMIGSVGSAISGVADKIRGLIHFSRPDEGPLRNYEEWMPDMMAGLAKGIHNNKNLLANEINGVAKSVKGGLTEIPLYVQHKINGTTGIDNNTNKTNATNNNNINITIQNMQVRKESDIKDIANALSKQINLEILNMA